MFFFKWVVALSLAGFMLTANRTMAAINLAYIKTALTPVYWTGATGTGSWNNAGNWSSGAVPSSLHLAIFDGVHCTGANCNATINANASVGGIQMKTGYGGTITQSAGFTLSIAAGGWRLQAGTFVGGNSNITITAGTFVMEGGVFTPTSATFKILANSERSGTVFMQSGGTYNAGTGTLYFSISGSGCVNGTTYTFDVPTSITVNNLTLAGGHTSSANTCTWAMASGDSFIVNGNFSIARDLTTGSVAATGTMFLKGNITVGAGAAGGNLATTMNGTGTQNITQTAGAVFPAGTLTISKSSGSAIQLSNMTLGNGNLTVSTGTFDQQNFTTDMSVITVASGATFRARVAGGVTADVFVYVVGCNYEYYGAGSSTFYWANMNCNLKISKSAGYYVRLIGNTATEGSFTNVAGSEFRLGTYTFGVKTSFSNSGTFTANTGTVSLNGGDQTISGSATFYNLSKIAAANNTLTFTAGTTQTITNALTLKGSSAGARLTMVSSTPGTQWSINPQGTRDVQWSNISDANNTNATAVPATTSIDSGNNTNWTITP
jgi:hypothetical protein